VQDVFVALAAGAIRLRDVSVWGMAGGLAADRANYYTAGRWSWWSLRSLAGKELLRLGSEADAGTAILE